VAAGCSDDTLDGKLDTEGFEPIACAANGRADLLSDLVLPVPVDYLELRANGQIGPPTQAAGDRCASASDLNACIDAVDQATAGGGFSLGDCVEECQTYYLVSNTADLVETHITQAEVLAFIAPIDGPADAVLAVALAGYDVPCGEGEVSIKQTADGYEVVGRYTDGTCEDLLAARVLVKSDGTTVQLEEVVEQGGCVD
jgi:hypothetical protein